MGQTYDFNVSGIPDLYQKKQAAIADPASDVTTCATQIAKILDVLAIYGMLP